jgi:hypothetical protein
LRHLTVSMTEAVTTPSPMMREDKSKSVDTRNDDVKEARGTSRESAKEFKEPAKESKESEVAA